MRGNLEEAVTLLGGTVMPGCFGDSQFIIFGDPSRWESLKVHVHHACGAPLDKRRLAYYAGKAFWKDGKLVQESYRYSGGLDLNINVNVTRPAQLLANDINKRLLIPAIEAHTKNVENIQRNIDYIAKMLAFGREFGDMDEKDRAVHVYANRDYSELAELTFISDQYATLNIRLHHDKMRKLINFIKSEIAYKYEARND